MLSQQPQQSPQEPTKEAKTEVPSPSPIPATQNSNNSSKEAKTEVPSSSPVPATQNSNNSSNGESNTGATNCPITYESANAIVADGNFVSLESFTAHINRHNNKFPMPGMLGIQYDSDYCYKLTDRQQQNLKNVPKGDELAKLRLQIPIYKEVVCDLVSLASMRELECNYVSTVLATTEAENTSLKQQIKILEAQLSARDKKSDAVNAGSMPLFSSLFSQPSILNGNQQPDSKAVAGAPGSGLK